MPFTAHGGFGQSYPAKPVTVIIPFGAGGTTDLIGRVVCEKLSQRMGKMSRGPERNCARASLCSN